MFHMLMDYFDAELYHILYINAQYTNSNWVRFINNSNNPNVFAYSFRKQIVISPLKVIQSGKELLLNYNDVIIEQQRAKNNTRRTRRPEWPEFYIWVNVYTLVSFS